MYRVFMTHDTDELIFEHYDGTMVAKVDASSNAVGLTPRLTEFTGHLRTRNSGGISHFSLSGIETKTDKREFWEAEIEVFKQILTNKVSSNEQNN